MTTWHALVIEGARSAGRAFVAGFLSGADARGGVVVGSDIGLAPASTSLVGRLWGLITAGTHEVLLAPEGLAGALVEALRADGATVGIQLVDRHVVVAASVGFRVRAFARDVAQRIRQDLVVAVLPEVRLDELVEREETDPNARGSELYAPAHEFTYVASGRFVGPLPQVLEMQRRARALEFVDVDPLHLDLG